MPNCDLCNTELNWSQGTQVSAVEFRRLVAGGLEPDDAMLAAATAMGLSKSQALHHWKTAIVGQDSGWLLCSQCTQRARRYGLTS